MNIIGNEQIREYFNNSVKNNDILHSYLCIGTSGIGKRLIAKEFSKKALCINGGQNNCSCKSCLCFDGNNHPDFKIINEEETTIKIDQIRELTKKVSEKPIISNRKIYIINDCDKMTVEAQNALLKTLEEPPEYITIILISSNENLIINTVKSRCMKLHFQDIDDSLIKQYCKEELQINDLTENMLKFLNGSIGKASKISGDEATFVQIEDFVKSFKTLDKITLLQNSKVLYDKDNIYDILDYLTVCMYSMAKEDNRFLCCIEQIQPIITRLKANANFDMTIDSLVFKMLEIFDK